jgi:hypothetical protein
MTLTQLLPQSLRRRLAYGRVTPIETEVASVPADEPNLTEAATPALKMLDPDIAAFEAALTRGQALRATGIIGGNRTI